MSCRIAQILGLIRMIFAANQAGIVFQCWHTAGTLFGVPTLA